LSHLKLAKLHISNLLKKKSKKFEGEKDFLNFRVYKSLKVLHKCCMNVYNIRLSFLKNLRESTLELLSPGFKLEKYV
jgi:hypothetical protein